MKTYKQLLVLAGAIALIAGCKSSNYETGAAAGAGLQTSADRISQGTGKIDAVLTNLNDIVDHPGDLVTREITWIGAYRFVEEISDALAAMNAGLDVSPLITHRFDIDRAAEALAVAADRHSGSSKVMLRLGPDGGPR